MARCPPHGVHTTGTPKPAPVSSSVFAQTLLKEAQTLREQSPHGEEGAAMAEKLLQIYQQLRNPSLVLL